MPSFTRSLVRHSRDECLYAAQALLHDVDRFWEAPGASIVKYDPATGDIAKLAIPMAHVYIQSIVLDETREMSMDKHLPRRTWFPTTSRPASRAGWDRQVPA